MTTARTVSLTEIVSYLDSYLRVHEVPDDANAHNGLQLENQGRIGRLVAAVDASQITIDGLGGVAALRERGPVLVLVHHGLYWDGGVPLVGRRYRRVRGLIDQDAALYAAHLPLDLHPEVGNNTRLATLLGLTGAEPFGEYRGTLIGRAGALPPDLPTRTALVERLATVLGLAREAVRLIPGGPERPRRIGVITGAAGVAVGQAVAAGCDTLVTGEGPAHTYFDAMELGVNLIYAGHYATETLGVRALVEHVGGRFALSWEFHDHPTGM